METLFPFKPNPLDSSAVSVIGSVALAIVANTLLLALYTFVVKVVLF